MFQIDFKPLIVLFFERSLNKERFIIFCFFEQLPKICANQIDIVKIDIIAIDVLDWSFILKNEFCQKNFSIAVDSRVKLDPSMYEIKQLTDILCYFDLILDTECDVG